MSNGFNHKEFQFAATVALQANGLLYGGGGLIDGNYSGERVAYLFALASPEESLRKNNIPARILWTDAEGMPMSSAEMGTHLAGVLIGDRQASAKGLTVNGMVNMAYTTADANGWHEEPNQVITPTNPKAQIGALASVIVIFADMVEAIRKSGTAAYSIKECAQDLKASAANLVERGPEDLTHYIAIRLGESDKDMVGSNMQMRAHLSLIVSEVGEAIQAVNRGDAENLGEELADIAIRLGDMVAWHNKLHSDRQIDLEAEILKKNERNKARGYRHGNKLA